MYFKQDLCKAIDIHEYDLNTVVQLGEALDQVRSKEYKFNNEHSRA